MADEVRVPIFVLTLLFSLLIQIGTNFANDYFDFVKGADNAHRKGPKRAVEQGWISPRSMLLGTFSVFAAAFFIAIPLMMQAGWWSYAIAAAAILFGTLYTGGPKPLGYLGLGELLVFIFFGPIAVCGTYFLQTDTLALPVFLASLAPGLLSCAILISNNLRDEPTDRIANKRTLVVRFKRRFGAIEYTLSIAAAAAIPFFFSPLVWTAAIIFPLSLPLIKRAFFSPDLVPLLPGTARLLVLYTILFCAAIW
jgi:1,4-dihydroxy-2-naphthoate octaprenyltransferase